MAEEVNGKREKKQELKIKLDRDGDWSGLET